jgi:1-acyl-sn-glycerol-3-phosphate acyltransferase
VNETYYLVSNHQGTFDPIFLVAASPISTSFISKEENLKLPVIGSWGRKIEFITFNRNDFEENVQMLRQSMRFLKSKKSLLVFPEGTRSRQQGMLDFKEGAFLPAYGSKVKILPVTLKNSFKMDVFHSNVSEIMITYHDPIEVSDYTKLSYAECAIKVKAIIESAL